MTLLPIVALWLTAAGAKPPAAQVPQQAQIINFNLLEALIAADAQDMAGVFGFIAEPNLPPALADYLLHNPKALKKFVKKGEKDLKETGGINEWDQQVFRYVLTLHSSGVLAEKFRLAKSWLERVSALSLSRPYSLSELKLRRKD